MGGTVTVAPWLPVAPLLGIVGQSVGREEAVRGRPFIGPAGRQLRAWLRVAGLHPDDDVAYTNVVMDYRPDDPNYAPSAAEIKVARPRIEQEFAVCPSLRAIVLVGATAAHLCFSGTMTAMQGRRAEWAGLPVWATFHPSYYLRAQSQAQRLSIEADVLPVLRAAAQVARGGVAPAFDLPTVRLYAESVVLR